MFELYMICFSSCCFGLLGRSQVYCPKSGARLRGKFLTTRRLRGSHAEEVVGQAHRFPAKDAAAIGSACRQIERSSRDFIERSLENALPRAVESGAHLEADRAVDRFLASYPKISPNSLSPYLSGPGLSTSKRKHRRGRSACVRIRLTLAEAA